jgi:hypothetical protein
MASFAGNDVDHISTTIINSYVIGNISGDGSYIGGIVGFLGGDVEDDEVTYVYLYAYIANSYSLVNVSGLSTVGGIAGMNAGNINNTYSMGNISNIHDYTGGITGMSYLGSVTNSYSLASVNGRDALGGITGFAYLGSTIQYNAAINPSIIGTTQQINR